MSWVGETQNLDLEDHLAQKPNQAKNYIYLGRDTDRDSYI